MDRVLAVDDDVELCELVAEYLEPEGFDVATADDGPEAVARALTGDYLVVKIRLPTANVRSREWNH